MKIWSQEEIIFSAVHDGLNYLALVSRSEATFQNLAVTFRCSSTATLVTVICVVFGFTRGHVVFESSVMANFPMIPLAFVGSPFTCEVVEATVFITPLTSFVLTASFGELFSFVIQIRVFKILSSDCTGQRFLLIGLKSST